MRRVELQAPACAIRQLVNLGSEEKLGNERDPAGGPNHTHTGEDEVMAKSIMKQFRDFVDASPAESNKPMTSKEIATAGAKKKSKAERTKAATKKAKTSAPKKSAKKSRKKSKR
jgi:hypothetical protein